MKKNMGTIDRSIRVALAIGMVVLFAMQIVEGALGYVLLGVAGIFVLTSLVSFCPLYTLVGIRTCPADQN
jgi:hypothetical protein